MKRIIIILLTATAILLTSTAEAQFNETNNLFYNTFRTPQSNMLNPAFFPNKNTMYLQLPSFGINFGFPLSINDIAKVEKQNDGSNITVIDIDNMLNTLTEENRFRLGMDINLLGFGFKIHHTFVTFNTKVRGDFNFGLPIDMINTLRQGNARTVNGVETPVSQMVLAGGDIFNTQFYSEISVGVGHYFKPINLTVGAHAKLLYGVLNVNLDNTNIVLNTYGNNFDRLQIDAYYELQAASAIPFDTTGGFSIGKFSPGDLINLDNSNTGMAFDIGAKYDLGPFSFSFSILDISSGIHWKNNVGIINPVNGHDTMSFAGIAFNELLNDGTMNTDTMVSALTNFVDNLKPSIHLGGDYWYSVPARVNLGATYNFAKMLRVGVLFHGQLDRGFFPKKGTTLVGTVSDIKNTFRWNTTFSLGVNVFNWIELIAGSSIVSDGSGSFNFMDNIVNPGVGIVLTPGTAVQMYFMADYVSSIYVTQAKAFNIKTGVNILIGHGGGSRISKN